MFKQCLQTMMEKVARIVSSNYGVSVVFQGAQAYTDGKSIVLPSLPPDASPDLVQDMQGYLDHEVAHVLFTEFNAVKGCKNHFHKWLSNHAEDSRIELEMIGQYPGTRLHLHPLNEKWTKIINDKWSEVSLMNRICMGVRAIQDGKEPRLDADTKPLFTKKVVSLSKSLRKAKNTWEIIETCGKILREIDKNQKEEEQKTEEQKEQEKQDSKGKEEAKKESEKTEEKNSEEDEGAGESEKTEDEGEEGSGGESDEEAEDEKSEGDDSGEGEESGESSDDGEPYDGNLSSEALKEELADSKESDCEDVHAYMDEQIKEEIKEEKEQNKNVRQTPQERRFDNSKRHLPFTTRYDEVRDFSKERCPDYKALQQVVRATVIKLVVELERVFKVKEEDRTLLEQERGRVSSKGLTRLVMDKNYRTPFKVRIKQETKNVAVQVVVDLSDSMGGQKEYVAQRVAAAVAEALAKLGIDCEVIGFQTGGIPRSAYDTMTGDMSRYNRTSDSLIHYLFKPFGSKNLEPISKMRAGGANCDGESIRWAAKRLEQHKAKRKVMMVLSDGMPACGDPNILNSDLKKAVKEITAAGIECVGIGIQSEAVKHFYPDYIVVNALGDLVTTTLKKLKSILTK